jgi:hypothetical protein
LIIVKTCAGIGNQLFQYACSRALALRRGTELRILNGNVNLDEHPDRPMRLWDFAVAAEPARDEDLHQATCIVLENPFGFLPALLDAPDNVVLDGFWQSEKYFLDFKDNIREELSFRDPELMAKARADVNSLRQQTGKPVVAVHVRRGDYVTASSKGIFHLLSVNWFCRAMAHFPEDVNFLVVSDDIPWCRANFQGPRMHFAAAASDPLMDLATMRACDHYIISNSTFGWWGAWLSDNPAPIVVGPASSAWFGPVLNALGKHDATHILPTGWISQADE